MKQHYQFARIYDLDEGQVLVTKEIKTDEQKYELNQLTILDGVAISLALGFKNEKKVDEAFDQYDKIFARKFLDSILNLLVNEVD